MFSTVLPAASVVCKVQFRSATMFCAHFYRGGSGGGSPRLPGPRHHLLRYVSLTVVNLTDTRHCIQSYHVLR